MFPVVPSENFEAVIDVGESGLVGTIGLVITDNQGGTTQAFSAAGIIESPASSGVYAATRVAPATVGQYSLVWTRGSGGETLGVDDLVVSGEVSTSTIPPLADDWVHGPCTNWIAGEDVADCCDAGVGTDFDLLDDVAAMSSALLFELSGRKYSGLCQRTVRPCRDACACWGGVASTDLWAWTASPLGSWWSTDCGSQRCGCGVESYVKLAGYPVREIVEVKIDGAVLDPSGYRLEQNQRLLRLADPGPPVVPNFWPQCQNLALADDQPGTWSITYTHGVAPPLLGAKAAAQLACELWKACPENEGECALPNKVTRVVRQGVTIEKIVPLADLLKEGATGLQLVDAFIAATNPRGIRRRPAILSPDLPRYPRRTS